MTIVRQDVIDGPTIQANGQYRGTVEFEFDDGRVITKNLSAPDATAWSEVLVDIGPELQAAQEIADANDGVSSNEEILANKQASREQRAVAYLRIAMEQEVAYDGYLLLDRFNTYRLEKGWNINQVAAGLASAGLESEEWDRIKTAYQYLSNAGRPAIMADNLTIQGNWENR